MSSKRYIFEGETIEDSSEEAPKVPKNRGTRKPLSDETKAKISAATKGRVANNKGKKEAVPHCYYTNGETTIRIPYTQTPPDGFRRGRTLRERSEEERKKWNLKVRSACEKKYGDPNYNNPQKGAQTKQDRYGSATYNNRVQAKETCINTWGVDNPRKVTAIKQKIVERGQETRKRNGTWSSSQPEKNCYERLCALFGREGVLVQYKEPRYPFRCDFYIKPLDLFIELNLTWHHGPHRFDPTSKEDEELLGIWKQKAAGSPKSSYNSAIKTWTVTDPMKFAVAEANNLNYIAIYKLDDFDFNNLTSSHM